MDLVFARREPAGVGEQIRAGGGGAEALEIVGAGKQLILLQPRVGAINLRAQEVHAELQIVAAKEPVGVGVELRVSPGRETAACRILPNVTVGRLPKIRQLAVVHRAAS